MEDFSIRAIVVGVSLFVTMLTLTAILIYFNTARGIADEVNKRTDIAESFDNIVNSEDYTDYLTGVEVRSLINKYAANKNLIINIVSISGVETDEYKNINNKNVDNGGWLRIIGKIGTQTVRIISEEKLDLINPVWNNKVEKLENSTPVRLNISLDVKE